MTRIGLRSWAVAGLLAAVAVVVGSGLEPARAQERERFRPTVDEYVVEPGDTLWAISDKIAGSALFWPRIWGLNPEVANPNWIYPGDVLYFYRRELKFPALNDRLLAAKDAKPESDLVVKDSKSSFEAARTPAFGKTRGSRRLVNLFITEDEFEEAGTLVNSANDAILLSNRDVVFIEFPEDQRPKKDAHYWVYRTVADVRHPIRGERFGYITEVTGFARVRRPRSDGVAVAELYDAELEIERGNRVSRVTRDLRESIAPKLATKRLEGVVVAVHSGWGEVGSEQQFAFVDQGRNAGLELGNELTVYRRSDASRDHGRGHDLPLRPIALLRVVDLKDHASTVLIVDSREEVEPGNKVRAITEVP